MSRIVRSFSHEDDYIVAGSNIKYLSLSVSVISIISWTSLSYDARPIMSHRENKKKAERERETKKMKGVTEV